jgi:hypothetical protein
VGTYALAPAFSITITLSGDHLEAQGTNQPKITLSAESENKFFSTEPDAQIEFSKNEKGVVDHLTLFQGGQQIRGEKK